MNTIDTRHICQLHLVGHTDIGRNHTVLNHAFRMASLAERDTDRHAVFITLDLSFICIKVNCTFVMAVGTNRIGTVTQICKQCAKVCIACTQFLIAIQDQIDIVVCHTFRRTHHGRISLVADDMAVMGNLHLTCIDKTDNMRIQRADAI